jgi:NADPH:quinone reductase-like Zn-dependent oxidoreductase
VLENVKNEADNEPAHHEVSAMKAIVQDVYGSADVLALREIEQPDVRDDEVRVRVMAAGVDRGALHLMTGVPYLMRILGVGLRRPKTRVPGTNVAGHVDAVGKAVTRFEQGDEVYGTCKGSYAEYACARAAQLAPKPANITFEQLAGVPHAGFAALQGLRDHGNVQPGQKVLIVGASGAVGSMGVQLAKAFGAHVTGVCSTSNVDMVRSLGADEVIDYTHDDFADGTCYDLVLDTGGNSSLSSLRRALTPHGTLVIVGGEGGGRWIGMGRQLRAFTLSPFVRQKLRTFVAKANARDLLFLNESIESGKVTPMTSRTYALSDAPNAIRDLETRQTQGRVAITVR